MKLGDQVTIQSLRANIGLSSITQRTTSITKISYRLYMNDKNERWELITAPAQIQRELPETIDVK